MIRKKIAKFYVQDLGLKKQGSGGNRQTAFCLLSL